MTTKHTDHRKLAARFLDHLSKLSKDRGAMADLRRALNPTQRHRAWPLLAQFWQVNDPRFIIFETVAGLFAHHPEPTEKGNIGTACLQLKGLHSTFEGRFRRLLSCDDREELCRQLRPVVLAAKPKGIKINYEQLFLDLWRWEWSERVKADWATAFWGAPAEEEAVPPANTEVAP